MASARLKPVINARLRVQKTGRNMAAKGEYNLDERSSVALSENLQEQNQKIVDSWPGINQVWGHYLLKLLAS